MTMSCYKSKSDSSVVCPNPEEFDKLCNYESKRPFSKIEYSPKDSRFNTYWTDVKNYGISNIRYSQYISYVNKELGKDSVSPKKDFPSETKNKHSNNTGSVSFTKEIKSKFGSNGSSTKKDGQKAAKFNSYIEGTAACMYVLQKLYNQKNICQINSKYQGGNTEGENCIVWCALRLNWCSRVSNYSGIELNKQLDLTNKDILKALTYGICSQETGISLSNEDLESAYSLFYSKKS